MIHNGIIEVSPEEITDELLGKCCTLFNNSFEKKLVDRSIRIFPSRIKKYLANSHIVCAFQSGALIGFLIYEVIENNIAWIKLIVVDKDFRKQKIGTRLVEKIIGFEYVGIITNNPIMVGIIKAVGLSICEVTPFYHEVFEKQPIKQLLRLYCVDKVLLQDNSYVVLTHLFNTQEITKTIDFSPLEPIEDGYEWFFIAQRDQNASAENVCDISIESIVR